MNPIPADLHHNHRLQLTYEPIETIQPNLRDPRVYSAAEKRRIAKSLMTFGAMPIGRDRTCNARTTRRP